jgi:aspartyl-tRNA(Asn)/glutamyl-tRNA(Gln) amidotransferase subunit A
MSGDRQVGDHDALWYAPASELAALLRTRELSAVELVEAFLDRIARVDPLLGAFVDVGGSAAGAAARDADRALAQGRVLGPLHGVPVSINDLDEVPGLHTTYGSWPLRHHVSVRASTCVERLTSAGAIVIGKTNTPEFGHKAVTDNAVRGPCSTPFDLTCNAGGSSGGSAAAVAAGLVPIAQAGDAGGSIRIPAALCGVYGLKPTYGRVAQVRRPHAFTTHMPFVHVGPITRTVEDAALTLQVLAGHVAADPMSMPHDGTDFVAATRDSIEGLRVAYLPSFGGYPVEAEVADRVLAGVNALEAAGARADIVDIPLPLSHDRVTELWRRQMGVGWAGVLAGLRADGLDLLDGHRDELSPEFLAAVETAERQTVRQTHEDLITRTRIADWVEELVTGYDVLATPTVGVSCVANGTDGRTLGPAEVANRPVERTFGWCLTAPLNFSGHPAASVPVGLTANGHPVGMQLAAGRFAETKLIAASAAVERMLPWCESYGRSADPAADQPAD